MDKYDAISDHYCYQGTTILKNKLNIHDLKTLEEAEREITALTIGNIHFKPPPYDLYYMCELHQNLFSELYEWAGELRNVDISKGGTRFCNWTRIKPEAQKIFTKIQSENWWSGLSKGEFCDKLAEYYCELNVIHPFREGNGRVQRLLFEHIALAAGYNLAWVGIQQNEWIQANIDGFNVNYEAMAEIFKRIISVCG